MYRSHVDYSLVVFCRGCLIFAASLLFAAVGFLFLEAFPAFTELRARLWSDATWFPTSDQSGSFGLAPMVLASLYAALSAVLIALPIAVAAASFIRFYSSAITGNFFSRMVEIAGAIPSVLIGLIGITVIVPQVNSLSPPGASLLSAILVLVLMILPTMIVIVLAGLERVSSELLTAAAACNLTRFSLLRYLILPQQIRTIALASTLSLARAIGETMAVVMVAGNVVQIPKSIFNSVRVLPANIALEMPYALGLHRAALFASGVVMILVVVAILALGHMFSFRGQR